MNNHMMMNFLGIVHLFVLIELRQTKWRMFGYVSQKKRLMWLQGSCNDEKIGIKRLKRQTTVRAYFTNYRKVRNVILDIRHRVML